MAPNKNVGANILIEDIPQNESNPAIEDIASIQPRLSFSHYQQMRA
jgi:hypothetical protein